MSKLESSPQPSAAQADAHRELRLTEDRLTEDRAAADTTLTAIAVKSAKSAGTADEIRDRIATSKGPSYWRSLEELAQTPEFRDMLHREFPRHASEWDTSFDRRKFLQLASASLGLAGLTACTKQPIEKIVPYVQQPEQVVPGRPQYYATTSTLGGYAVGVLAESHLGRPTKVEGNPEHPASLGRTDAFTQATVLDLYDPDRSTAVVHVGKLRTWSACLGALRTKTTALRSLSGQGLRVLSGTVTSPTQGTLLRQLLEEMPEARWHQYDAAGRHMARRGAMAAFGEAAETHYDIKKADVIVAFDSDFLTLGPGAVRYARDFAERRKVHDPEVAKKQGMNRLYAVESTVSSTGTSADHRMAVKPTEVGHVALALAAELGVAGASKPAGFDGERAKWVAAVAEDLKAHGGSSLVVVGEEADAEVHVLAHAINEMLGNVGETVVHTEAVEVEPVDQIESLRELVEAMNAGDVDTLLILDTNAAYNGPADVGFVEALKKVSLRIHVGGHYDETAAQCHWHVPLAHELERWGDGRAYDGTLSLTQPIIEPLYGGKTVIEVLGLLLDRPLNADELLKQEWLKLWDAGVFAGSKQAREAGTFERFWRRVLHDGFVEGSAAAVKAVAVDGGAVAKASSTLSSAKAGAYELAFRVDPTVYDGCFSNNGWLQECPKPITKLTWDNALLVSPKTAEEIGYGDLIDKRNQRPNETAPLVTVTVDGRDLEVPLWVVPGLADGAMTLHLGYGRERCGKVGEGVGFNAYALRGAASPWHATAQVAKARGTYPLASTQDHHSMEGRDLVRAGRFDTYVDDPHSMEPHYHVDPNASLMTGKDFPYESYSWGMTIDLTSCTGCNACLVACQSENNIPVIGKEQVAKGREMHWIRIDRYFVGNDADNVDTVYHQPVNCMQCEQAPCEVVCPVAATVHSDEGLNDMVYNRCVGTRYCSNNCPYKVRRFNFLLYQDFETPSLQLGRNPDVTVRSRGVMEKCTYCVQRISKARIEAKREDRKIRDGEVVTACQQVCPSDAIAFGDINTDITPESMVAKIKQSPLNYSLLAELGTRPRTTYLARMRNPNPRLEPPSADAGHGAGHGGAHGGGGEHGGGH